LTTHNSTRNHCTRSSTEEFEDTKGAIRIRISKNNRQHNGQKKKGQKDKQRSTKYRHQIKDRVTRTPLKTGNELLHLPLSHLPSLKQMILQIKACYIKFLKQPGEIYDSVYCLFHKC